MRVKHQPLKLMYIKVIDFSYLDSFVGYYNPIFVFFVKELNQLINTLRFSFKKAKIMLLV